MTGDAELADLRATMIEPYWGKYLGRSFDLEYAASGRDTYATVSLVVEEWRSLDVALARTDPAIAAAIRRVLNYELHNLIIRCKYEAEHFAPLKREAGLI